MRFEKNHISDWARSHSMAAGSFASQDDRWQNTNTKRGSHDQVMRMPATIRKLLNILFLVNFCFAQCMQEKQTKSVHLIYILQYYAICFVSYSEHKAFRKYLMSIVLHSSNIQNLILFTVLT